MTSSRTTVRLFLALFLSSAPFLAIAQETDSQRLKFTNPKTVHAPFGYTHVVESKGGRTLYVSGQVGLDLSGNLVGASFPAQTQQAFENLKAVLEGAGASFKDVVKLNIHVVDISQLPAFREVRDKYIDTANPPASTAVEVSKLYAPEVLIEIDAVAVVPE